MIHIVIMSAPMLSSLFQNLKYTLPPNVKIHIVDATLDKTATIAKQIETDGKVDVFVTGGAGHRILSSVVKKPLIEISVTGFDILHALKAARRLSDRVAIFAFREQIENIERVRDVLAMNVKTIIYDPDGLDEIESVMDGLAEEGIRTIIGSSLIFQTANCRGINAIFIYSKDSLTRALNQAVQIAMSNYQEIEKSKKFKTVLDFAYGGIIATDANGVVTSFNPAAEKITGIAQEKALGSPIVDLFPHTRMPKIVCLKEPALNQIISVGNRCILTNHIPIILDGIKTGAVITFQDIATIQEEEVNIRRRLFSKGFVVKTNLNDVHGNSPAILRVKEEAKNYASSNATIIILGESGTGKEIFARGIHNASARASGPFVAINCAAFAESLLESELFGYDNGAFTGARRGGKIGLIELAHRGTLFFDEISEMSQSLQTRMLRVLEEREVLHIGGEKIIPVDIRVIAACNKDLRALVHNGRFREDLYYRLNVLTLCVPPLRERYEDIPHLVSLFLTELLPEMPAEEIQKIAKHPCFCQYDWPGNVRELKNFVERFAVLSRTSLDTASLLTSLFRSYEGTVSAIAGNVARILSETGGNKSEAARKLGISRTTLWRKLKHS